MLENNQIQNLLLIKDLGMQYATIKSKQRTRFALFKCFCGNYFKAGVQDVKKLTTRSCGCLVGKPNITHGLSKHRLYGTWSSMINRCNNKDNHAYKDYGGRGISVCERWLNVANFIEDMYPSYQYGLSIDRINVNGNYEPDNCRWADKRTQTRNTRKLVSKNTTGYRGINISGKKYISRISTDNGRVYLGIFETAIEAAKAYDQYVIDNNLQHTRNFI